MEQNSRLQEAIARLESCLQEDPREAVIAGVRGPRDFLFTRRCLDWIQKLTPSPGEDLLVATWGHVLYRWQIARDGYPKTPDGYHNWRGAQSRLAAVEVEKILRGIRYDESAIAHVRELILKTTFPKDPDSRILEDATCLVFLETKLEDYRAEWEQEGKMVRILKGTWRKMTPRARELAKTIPYSPEAQKLLSQCLR